MREIGANGGLTFIAKLGAQQPCHATEDAFAIKTSTGNVNHPCNEMGAPNFGPPPRGGRR